MFVRRRAIRGWRARSCKHCKRLILKCADTGAMRLSNSPSCGLVVVCMLSRPLLPQGVQAGYSQVTIRELLFGSKFPMVLPVQAGERIPFDLVTIPLSPGSGRQLECNPSAVSDSSAGLPAWRRDCQSKPWVQTDGIQTSGWWPAVPDRRVIRIPR